MESKCNNMHGERIKILLACNAVPQPTAPPCGDSSAVGGGRAGRPARPRKTALLPPSSDGKPEAATAVVVASDDGHENARNMLSCI